VLRRPRFKRRRRELHVRARVFLVAFGGCGHLGGSRMELCGQFRVDLAQNLIDVLALRKQCSA
jgi:hypothetical protein